MGLDLNNRLNMKRLIVITLVVSVVLIFQNCADPLDLASEDSASFQNKLPFAYDNTLDTISYMSCSGMPQNFEPRAYYTFRGGAYTSMAGLGLTKEFRSATANFTDNQRAESLSASARNSGAYLQMAVRMTADYTRVYSANNAEIRENRDIGNFPGPLDSVEISRTIASLKEGKRANYFNGMSGLTGRILEASLRFLDNELVASSLRTQLANREGLLTVTYTEGADPLNAVARTPEGTTSKSRAFGIGYVVSFANETGVIQGERRVLDQIAEVDLTTGSSSGSSLGAWDCPRDYRFVIIRPEDRGLANGFCSTTVDVFGDEAQRLRLEAARRVLRVEDWWVDAANRCVVPKPNVSATSCYGDRTNKPALAYRITTCTADNCPHYVSICTRR